MFDEATSYFKLSHATEPHLLFKIEKTWFVSDKNWPAESFRLHISFLSWAFFLLFFGLAVNVLIS